MRVCLPLQFPPTKNKRNQQPSKRESVSSTPQWSWPLWLMFHDDNINLSLSLRQRKVKVLQNFHESPHYREKWPLILIFQLHLDEKHLTSEGNMPLVCLRGCRDMDFMSCSVLFLSACSCSAPWPPWAKQLHSATSLLLWCLHLEANWIWTKSPRAL